MNQKSKLCLCSSLLPEEIKTELAKHFTLLDLLPDELLDVPVRCHPDMICSVMDNYFFCPRSYAERYPSITNTITSHSGMTLILTDVPRSAKYPYDVSLNTTVLPDALICRSSSTAPELITAARNSSRKIISVRQGYAGCSCMTCASAVLTSDAGIHRLLTQNGMDSTLISNRGIHLAGYDTGFIGGCGGICENTMYLFGTPNSIPDGSVILDFASRHGLDIHVLADAPLADYGGIKFI